MVDLHSHILPGLDDGAQDLEVALEMARIAVADGITDMIATPHTHDGVYRNFRKDVLYAIDGLQQALTEHSIPLRIYSGNEIHVHVGFIDHVVSRDLLTINDQCKYLLLELPVQSVPRFVDDLIYELRVEGITPILAHPERNAVLRENPNRLAEWIEQGALAQLTAGSLTGAMGERARETAQYMIKHQMAHVIATDAHNVRRRRPELTTAYQVLAEWTSKAEGHRYRENALAILRGEECQVLEPIRQAKKRRFFFF